MNREYRNYGEFREAGENNGLTLSGYAARFNSMADIWGWKEMVRPGAFKKCLANSPDVRFLFNHKPSLIFGRTKAGTLKLNEDATGLHFDNSLPDTQSAKDLHLSIKRGDISQCSFAFFNATRIVSTLEDGTILEELVEMDIDDVSAVTYPAYPETEVIARTANNALKNLKKDDLDKAIKHIREKEVRSLFDNKILEIGAISENKIFPGWELQNAQRQIELNKKYFEQEEK